MKPDSELVRRVVPSLGFRRGKYEQRTRPPVAIVIHTTGAGPVRRFADEEQRRRYGWKSPFDAALSIYAGMMEAGPHYLIGQRNRELAQVCPEHLCAWGVGGRGARPYRHPFEKWPRRHRRKAEWWPERWPSLSSPRELAGGRLWTPYAKTTRIRTALASGNGSVNANVIHLEVVPPEGKPRGAWTAAAWGQLVELVRDIADRHDVPVDRFHIISHSDAHPIARSTRSGGPWDPGPVQWSWARFARRAEIPLWCVPSTAHG